MALLLQRKGVTRIHPLEGGIDAWLANKFPLEGQDWRAEAAAGASRM